MPGRTRSKCASGSVRVAALLAKWRSSGRTPRASASASASAIDLELGGDARVAGLVGAGEVRPHRGDDDRAVGLRLGRGVDQVGPVADRRAGPREPGVDLEVDARRDPGHARLGDDVVEHRDVADRQVDAVRKDCREVLVRGQQPGEHGRVDAGGAQRGGLAGVGDAEPAAPPAQGRPRRRTAPWP